MTDAQWASLHPLLLRGLGSARRRTGRRSTARVECDVCVVGGGIAGCSAALHLAERGYRVVLLGGAAHRLGRLGAQRRPGHSGVAAGQAKLERLIGPTARAASGTSPSRGSR